MTHEYTETELKIKISEFYNRPLTLQKAKAVYKMEFGVEPTIVEDTKEFYVGYENILNRGDIPEYLEYEHFVFMKNLQNSGVTNMIESAPYAMKTLLIDKDTAKELVIAYMRHYEELYDPASLMG